jgi:hypothetical protein
MSQQVVLPQVYAPLWKAVSVDHGRSPATGPPSDWDLLGSDAVVVTAEGGKILIGERFRRAKYESFGDITLRWRSSMTGKALEINSLNCQYFVYGYVDDAKMLIGSWWVIYPNKLLEAIRSGSVRGREFTNPEEGGSVFMAFDPYGLFIEGCIYKAGVGPIRQPDTKLASKTMATEDRPALPYKQERLL